MCSGLLVRGGRPRAPGNGPRSLGQQATPVTRAEELAAAVEFARLDAAFPGGPIEKHARGEGEKLPSSRLAVRRRGVRGKLEADTEGAAKDATDTCRRRLQRQDACTTGLLQTNLIERGEADTKPGLGDGGTALALRATQGRRLGRSRFRWNFGACRSSWPLATAAATAATSPPRSPGHAGGSGSERGIFFCCGRVRSARGALVGAVGNRCGRGRIDRRIVNDAWRLVQARRLRGEWPVRRVGHAAHGRVGLATEEVGRAIKPGGEG